jgi:hypothetical protein
MLKKEITMVKTSPIVIFLLLLALILSGCSGGAATAAASSADSTAQGAAGTGQTLTLNEKLAAGTLKLEGTDLAVTAEQAKELLPLWKAVKTLSTSDTASQLEIEAVYQQIQDTLTADQLAAIEALDLSGSNMQQLMTDLGIEFGNPTDTGLTDSQRATRIAELRASGQFNQGSRPGGADGAPSGGFQRPSGGAGGFTTGGNFPPDGAGAGAVPGATGTQTAPRAGGRGGFGISRIFIDPLIKLLTTRAAG